MWVAISSKDALFTTGMKPSCLQYIGLPLELTLLWQDALLARVQDLWKATKVLVDDEPRWKLTAHLAVQGTSSAADVPLSEHNVQIDEATHSEAYDLVCSQLRAAAEKRGAQLSKTVMNDLERRLLRRWQDSWFETFLVAIILLNCVERMCWLYRTWDDSQWHSKVQIPSIQLVTDVGISLIAVASGQPARTLFSARRALLRHASYATQDAQYTTQNTDRPG